MGGDDYPPLALIDAYNAARVGWENLKNPDFDAAGNVHDWRNYVPGVLKDLWWVLEEETRMAVFLMAKADADREEWD